MNGKRACLFATDPPYLVAYDGTNHPHKWNDSEELKRRKNKDWSDKYTDVDSPELGEALYDAFMKVAVEHAITDHAAWYSWHASRKQALLEAVATARVREKHVDYHSQSGVQVESKLVVSTHFRWLPR